MNDQQKAQDSDQSEKEFINGTWVDVKLCTIKAKLRKQNLPVKVIKETLSDCNNSSSTLYYNELHYGNYE